MEDRSSTDEGVDDNISITDGMEKTGDEEMDGVGVMVNSAIGCCSNGRRG